MRPINPADSPDSIRWDGSGQPAHRPQRALRLHPGTRTRLLRAAQIKPCTRCGNLLEWCYRDDGSRVPLHPGELPLQTVPVAHRWHILEGVARPGADGTAWCRLPHTALCPALEHPAHGPLTALRRALALNTRRLLDAHHFTPRPEPEPAPPPATDTAARRQRRDIVQLFHTFYLAPGRVEQIPCVALTVRRSRCPRSLTHQASDTGAWTTVPVPPGQRTGRRHRRQGELTDHLTGTPMAVYDLTGLPYAVQLRWRSQHCPVHADSPAADIALTAWQPFDAFAHHQHITPTTPAPVAVPAAAPESCPGEWPC